MYFKFNRANNRLNLCRHNTSDYMHAASNRKRLLAPINSLPAATRLVPGSTLRCIGRFRSVNRLAIFHGYTDNACHLCLVLPPPVGGGVRQATIRAVHGLAGTGLDMAGIQIIKHGYRQRGSTLHLCFISLRCLRLPQRFLMPFIPKMLYAFLVI